MILLLDASAVVDLLLRTHAGTAVRRVLSADPDAALVSVGHLDAEVLSALARLARAATVTEDEVATLLARLATLPMQRLPVTGDLLSAAWAMRANVAVRDALYVAATQRLGARLVTTDERLGRAVPELVAAGLS